MHNTMYDAHFSIRRFAQQIRAVAVKWSRIDRTGWFFIGWNSAMIVAHAFVRGGINWPALMAVPLAVILFRTPFPPPPCGTNHQPSQGETGRHRG